LNVIPSSGDHMKELPLNSALYFSPTLVTYI
jgi:hypothetical protein